MRPSIRLGRVQQIGGGGHRQRFYLGRRERRRDRNLDGEAVAGKTGAAPASSAAACPGDVATGGVAWFTWWFASAARNRGFDQYFVRRRSGCTDGLLGFGREAGQHGKRKMPGHVSDEVAAHRCANGCRHDLDKLPREPPQVGRLTPPSSLNTAQIAFCARYKRQYPGEIWMELKRPFDFTRLRPYPPAVHIQRTYQCHERRIVAGEKRQRADQIIAAPDALRSPAGRRRR